MRGTQFNVTMGTSSMALLGPNPNRVSLTFSADGTNTLTASTLGTAVIGEGITLTPTNPTQTITEDQIGSRIRQPWTVIANNTGSLITVFEGFA